MCWQTVGRDIGQYVVDISTESGLIVGRHVIQVNRPLVDTISWYVGRHSAETSTDVLRSTVGGVSVDCWWYWCIANCCFAEIAAISLPTGDAKEESLSSMLMCWWSEDAAQTAVILNTFLMQLEVSTIIAGKNSHWDRRTLPVWRVKNGWGPPKDPLKRLEKII